MSLQPILIQAADLPQDPVQVLKAQILADQRTLHVVVFFRGSHPDHKFSLSAGPFAEMEPKQVELTVGHDAEGDVMAKAMREEELSFDLHSIKAEHERLYGSSEGVSIQLVLGDQVLIYTM
eukprot:TRINITY_DN615_c0_g1_i1.p2 TRINITY_DN615_c0_g1~~TRINITY_DN615_c0_g1_i1.p2  ORF type:complete len:121 (+),score=27.24 TRINITY_DN615_c0_g1_i1:72-434(+)